MSRMYFGAHATVYVNGKKIGTWADAHIDHVIGVYWKFDIGDQITIPRDNGTHTRGMVLKHVPDMGGDPYGDRYIVKDDDSPTAVYYQKKFLDREAFVSQLSLKEQAMEESCDRTMNAI